MQFTTKTTKFFEKAIRFTDRDKAFGVMVYLDCARIAEKDNHPALAWGRTDIVEVPDADLGRSFWYVILKTCKGDTLYLQHPLAA